MRTMHQLIEVDEPAIDLLREWAGRPGANRSVVLPPDPSSCGPALERLQVTTRSLLGAIVYGTGGLLIDGGLLRIFGSGAARSILRSNEAVGEMTAAGPRDVLLIADDLVGGLYALNGGRFGQATLGGVYFLSAESMTWSGLDVGYSDFIGWCLTGDIASLREELEDPVYAGIERSVEIDRVNAFYPFLWTQEARDGGPDVRLIDADESLRLRIEMLGFEAQG